MAQHKPTQLMSTLRANFSPEGLALLVTFLSEGMNNLVEVLPETAEHAIGEINNLRDMAIKAAGGAVMCHDMAKKLGVV